MVTVMQLVDTNKLKGEFNAVSNKNNCEVFDISAIETIIDCATIIDAVEVVRCENCINRDNKSGICMEFRQRYPFYPSKDFYCGFGKKKE